METDTRGTELIGGPHEIGKGRNGHAQSLNGRGGMTLDEATVGEI